MDLDRPAALANPWLHSIATVLPLAPHEEAPYTLGEAVAELGSYARAVADVDWGKHTAGKNRESLRREINAQFARLGPRLRNKFETAVAAILATPDGHAIAEQAAAFATAWSHADAIQDGFRDLCDVARNPAATTRSLRRLSALTASQIGPAAVGSLSVLTSVANILIDSRENLSRFRHETLPDPISEEWRLAKAEERLVSIPEGHAVVWMAYFRASVGGMRTRLGPITFLRPDWALPSDSEHNLFPEREELHAISDHVYWLREMNEEDLNNGHRIALVRVDLGMRQVAGAIQEARRRVEAVLSVAVASGGVSWMNTGSATVLLDGQPQWETYGGPARELPHHEDNYGVGATGSLLTHFTEQLQDAFDREPMPEPLIEALTAIRESRMTDHRDVSLGASGITPRVATALEDHAMELISFSLGVHATALANAVQIRRTLDAVQRITLGQLTGPLKEPWVRLNSSTIRDLERELITPEDGYRVVSISKTLARQEDLRALELTQLVRADFEDAVLTLTSPDREQALIDECQLESRLLRDRYRRVRNAINHGLPLHTTTLQSVRVYGDDTSTTAMDLALTWFKTRKPGHQILGALQTELDDLEAAIHRGESRADRDRS